MAEINWGLAGGGNSALSMFNVGAQLGQQFMQAREAKAERSALAAYATNPDDPAAMEGLAKYRPDLVIQARQQQAAGQVQQQQQRRADLPMMARLLEGVTPENYQQRIAEAQQYGIDTSTLPQQFDPALIEQTRQTVQMLQTPQGQEALSTAGKIAADMGLRPGTPEFNAKVTDIWHQENTRLLATQAGGGVASFAPGGQPEFLIQPNEGGAPAGAPVGYTPAPAAGPQGGAPESFTGAQIRANIQSMGAPATVDWMRRNGVMIRVENEGDYNLVPPGFEYIAPDGTRRRKGGQ